MFGLRLCLAVYNVTLQCCASRDDVMVRNAVRVRAAIWLATAALTLLTGVCLTCGVAHP